MGGPPWRLRTSGDPAERCALRLPQEVGAASGRVLDDLIRHAQVLGMQDFTRSDALATAEYRNDFKQYKCVRGC